MDIKEIREDLELKIKKIPPLGKTLKFVLDNEIVVIDGRGDENVLHARDEAADCTLTMSVDTYGKIQENKIKAPMAVLRGKLKVKGDIPLAHKLQQLRRV